MPAHVTCQSEKDNVMSGDTPATSREKEHRHRRTSKLIICPCSRPEDDDLSQPDFDELFDKASTSTPTRNTSTVSVVDEGIYSFEESRSPVSVLVASVSPLSISVDICPTSTVTEAQTSQSILDICDGKTCPPDSKADDVELLGDDDGSARHEPQTESHSDVTVQSQSTESEVNITLTPVRAALILSQPVRDDRDIHGRVRGDMVMDLTFAEMLVKNRQNSHCMCDFKMLLARDINYKYCSWCQCDYMWLVALNICFGIFYLSAGVIGLMHCATDAMVIVYLFVDGALNVLVFPTTVLDWKRRICGCEDGPEDGHEELRQAIFYQVVTALRVTAVVSGMVLVIGRRNADTNKPGCGDDIYSCVCVGVTLDGLVLLVVLLPWCMYTTLYYVASFL